MAPGEGLLNQGLPQELGQSRSQGFHGQLCKLHTAPLQRPLSAETQCYWRGLELRVVVGQLGKAGQGGPGDSCGLCWDCEPREARCRLG